MIKNISILILAVITIPVWAAAPTPHSKPVINKTRDVNAMMEENRRSTQMIRTKLSETYCLVQPYGGQNYLFCYYKDDLEVLPLKPNKI